MTDPVVIVGGDAAGLSAASKLSREDPDREVIVFERGRWVSYAHCGEPYFVKGEVDELDDLLSLSPAEIDERGIDLRREHEVVAIDTDARTVSVAGPEDSFEQPYGDLVVATGATARTDPIAGSELTGAFTIHGLDSAAAVRAMLTPPDEFDVDDLGGGDSLDHELVARYGAMAPPETAAIVGGGYVGVEMAEALDAWDVDVHLFQRSALPVPMFGEAVGETVADHLRERGVDLHLGAEVDRVLGEDGRVTGVRCEDGSTLDAELAVVGVGVTPNVEIVENTPVELGEGGAIAVDEYGETAVEDVYAAGDCAEDHHVVTGETAWVPLGLTANRAGRAIGRTLAGTPTETGGIAGTAVVKAFEQECGRTGIIDADEARDAGFDPVSRTITAGSRSGYYPGNEETTVTLVADRASGRLIGGSIVGKDRAAVRIDTVATALEGGLTVDEVERLDLAYAPPFSPVWDPVLVAAKVLNGALEE
ncbi:FAD-dependent oxidoreductase [Halobaculum magnesiiphilum]|uniref:FAD-dependent oxidoreductase n=1 Tax=Halobaculum magnesiiphilum TaxID=1017351 RepID=A0A8T8WI71_9EURY|nr:FAD-dependent oxidoreductase [Halobaculum magnesiiphilum]QZP39433.1 FAD-dependent oxidoreductase [Halobaculum magnesiiphilum]